MQFILQTPQKATRTFAKQKPTRIEIDLFKENLNKLLNKIEINENKPKKESEAHQINDLRDFLRDTYYKEYAFNTKYFFDLAIHLGEKTTDDVGVIIEAKRPTNISEMVTETNPVAMAMFEIILYYLRERHAGNLQLKQLVITNVNEWFILDANNFDKYIYSHPKIKKLFDVYLSDKKDNPWFYEEIKKILQESEIKMPCVYFDITNYKKIIAGTNKEFDKALISLYKVLSPQYLLKLAIEEDSNALNSKFYNELLHIIGLEEVKETNKIVIQRKSVRNNGSLLELTIDSIKTEEILHRITNINLYGDNEEDQLFNIALELCITWINRILFLKLLEGQLFAYHNQNKDYKFLNSDKIESFDEIFKLFHKVLAVNYADRSESIQKIYKKIPYLNSSLFEISELEDQALKINALDDSVELDFYSKSILNDKKIHNIRFTTLNYLLRFLSAYDFASESFEEIQEENKQIINASVLGKVFEKINGYKDGSVYTPAFITMYMCRESIRMAVVQKFNDTLKLENQIDSFESLKSYTQRFFNISDLIKFNSIINSTTICDPAVGSGHFLVSALNELIVIKNELKILLDHDNNALIGYDIEIINDELIISKENLDALEYKFVNGKPTNEMQKLQKTMFKEKQNLIENCLFGVDINPKSVLICRLRLWIELLKNAYYREESQFTELETLPNLDINIKCGNSLISRFDLNADLSKALKSVNYNINSYKGFVKDYKNEKNREVKRELQKIIDQIKFNFKTEISNNDPKKTRLAKLAYELYNRFTGNTLFEDEEVYDDSEEKKSKRNKKELELEKKRKAEQCKIEDEIAKLKEEIDALEKSVVYRNAFEWRFEFPEVLNENGDFIGFDLVIGNPPYINVEMLEPFTKEFLYNNYITCKGRTDIYIAFIEKVISLLKQSGNFIFIIPYPYTNQNYGSISRKLLIEKYWIREILDTSEYYVFDKAIVKTIILFVSKKSNAKTTKIKHSKSKLNFEKNKFEVFNLNQNEFLNLKDNRLETKNLIGTLDIKNKIWDNSLHLGEICLIAYGARLNHKSEKLGKEVFIHYDYKSEFKPFLEGKNIQRYEYSQFGWLDYQPDKHYNSMFTELFENEKLFFINIVKDQLRFAFDDKNFYNSHTVINCLKWDLLINAKHTTVTRNITDIKIKNAKNYNYKFLLGVLNSNLINWYFKFFLSESLHFYPDDAKELPIKILPITSQQPFIDLVDQILVAKKEEKDTRILENQIDNWVYKLYELTYEEVKIVDPNFELTEKEYEKLKVGK